MPNAFSRIDLRARDRLIRLAPPAFLVAAFVVFSLYVASKAFWAAFANQDFPDSLAVKVELLPRLFPLHMVSGGLALLLLPLTYGLRNQRRWHRLVGRGSALVVLVSGLTAYPVAWVAPVTLVSAAGFSAQASLWLILLLLGVHAIRRRQVARHRACMLLMMAVTSGAIFFRILLALWGILGSSRHFALFYACDAWGAWMTPLAGAAWALRRSSTSGAEAFR